MNSPLFKVAPFFLLRTSVRSEEDLDQLLSNEDNWVDVVLSLFEKDSELREAILIASPSLYNSLLARPLKNRESIAASLMHYLIRMSTRSTPFGLFSLVMNGSWGARTDVSFEIGRIKKLVRPDMEWLFLLVQRLYQNRELIFSLPVQTNQLVLQEGGQYILNYLFRLEVSEGEPLKHVSVQETSLIKAILSLAKESITIEGLWEKLQPIFPSLQREKIKDLFLGLLNQQLLLPALIPSLLSDSPFGELCAHLPFSQEQIVSELDAYQQAELGKGEALLLKLQNTMQALVSTKNVLQVDVSYSHRTQQIGSLVAKELEQSLDLLWKLSPALNAPSPFDDYIKQFLEVYGSHRTVPLMELFSENQGLGSFHKYGSAPKPKRHFIEQWERWLSRQLQEALHFGKEEIVLSTEAMDALFKETEEPLPNPESGIPSLDLFCTLFAPSAEAIDLGEFEILFSQSNWQGGGAAGRFLELLGKQAKVNFQDYLQAEEALEPNSIIAELSYWPFSVRKANVAIQPCLRAFRLDLGERKKNCSSLFLEDIYVGVANNRFYLSLKEGGKELIFRTGNFLNPEFAPPAIKFCRDVSLFRSQRLSSFSWGKLQKSSIFLPRIRFQKTILSPAQWNLDLTTLGSLKSENLKAQFDKWADSWNLPRHFFLCEGDKQLLVDRNHPSSLAEFMQKLKKGKPLLLIEKRSGFWMKSQRGSHISELVVPFLKTIPSKNSLITRPYTAASFNERWKLPGSDWIYISFYLHERAAGSFLVNKLSKFASFLCENGAVTHWFFLHYSYPETHIRLRLHLASDKSLSSVLTLLEEEGKNWIQEGRIRKYEILPYQREIERYGGPNSIEAAEKLFHADSVAATFLRMSKPFQTPNICLHAVCLLAFLKDFGFNDTEMLACLGEFPKTSHLNGFREVKNDLIRWIEVLKGERKNEPGEIEIGQLFIQASEVRSSAIGKFCALAPPFATRPEIYDSLLHMHSNRLGLDQNGEQKARQFARYGLKLKLTRDNPLSKPLISMS